MNTTTKFKNGLWITFRNQLALHAGVLTLVMVLASSARAATPPTAIPFSDIGAKATADYHGDALGITATADGARLRCGFQKLEGHATPQGLCLESTEAGSQGKLRLVATALRRGDNSALNSELSINLPGTGTVTIKCKLVEFTRPGVTEEYSVSVNGVRQDFVVTERPAGTGDLHVKLALSGARAEATAHGVKLTFEASRRVLAYSRLRAEDATGRELAAHLEVLSADGLTIRVADGDATYPVRIDPTFSDADWVSLNPGMPGADDTVLAVAMDNSGNVYAGGDFSVIGTVRANGIAKWDGSDWSALGSGINGGVNALAVSGTNLYAGGYFTNAGGVPANHVAKWDGQVWSGLGSGLGAGMGASWRPDVYALAVRGTNLYVGGRFTTAGGVLVKSIAKWDGSTWSALRTGVGSVSGQGIVSTLVVSGGALYVGGSFTGAGDMTGGVKANNIAKWNGDYWEALGPVPALGYLGPGVNGPVYTLAVSGNKLYVGGHFTKAGRVFADAGWVSATNIAKWDGSTWSALGSGMNDAVQALAISGPNLYAGGWFTVGGGVLANYIAKWDGSAWSALGSGMGRIDNTGYAPVFAMAASGNSLVAGGSFTKAGGVPANQIAKWDGSAWSAFGSGVNNTVYALAVSETNLYAGGAFTTVGEVTANHIAKWDGSAWSALGSGFNNSVRVLAVSGTNLYAGGDFTTAGGLPANHIAKWDGSTWSALGSGLGSFATYYAPVYALAVSGNDLYAAGYFTNASGVPAKNVAKWDGNTWSALGSGVDGTVHALTISGPNLYAGGYFYMVGGVAATNIAKWDGSTWSALGSGITGIPDDGRVYALAVSGTNLYAGGDFTKAGAVAAKNIAKWDGSAWSALGSGLNDDVQALAVIGTDLYAGGYSIAKWDGNTWSPLGSGTGGNSPVIRALAVDEWVHLFVGGDFSLAGTNVSPFIAEANLGSAPTLLTPLQSQTAESGSTVVFTPDIDGYPAMTCLLLCNATNLVCCSTHGCLTLTNVDFSMSCSYTIVVTNVLGAVTSAPVILNVIPPVERRPVPAVNMMGVTGTSLNVEYTDALGSLTDWLPLDIVNLTEPPQYWFDLTEPLPSQRFYRVWQTGMPTVYPSLNLPGIVPAITLTGNVGDSLRLDYINAIGPTDAWVTLDTVTLTNTSQLYFDTSSIGQPRRLYRIVPGP